MTTPINDIAQLHPAFEERFNARDIEGLLELSAPGAVFIPAPGQPVDGDGVRAALEQYLSLGLPISMTVRHAFVSGNTGLVVTDWSISGNGPDGSAVELGGATSDVVARDAEHGWRFVIDNPFGTV